MSIPEPTILKDAKTASVFPKYDILFLGRAAVVAVIKKRTDAVWGRLKIFLNVYNSGAWSCSSCIVKIPRGTVMSRML